MPAVADVRHSTRTNAWAELLLKRNSFTAELHDMGTSNRQHPTVLIGLLALMTSACGGVPSGATSDSQAATTTPTSEPIASLASVDHESGSDEVEATDFDLELSISEGETVGDVVTVTVEIRSVGEDVAQSPFILVDLGPDMALSESNVTCFDNQSEIVCAALAAESDEATSETHVLDVAIIGANDGDDSIVTFTADSAETQMNGDSDLTNNSMTVMFIETESPATLQSDEDLSTFAVEPTPVQPAIEEEPPVDTTDLYTLEVHTDGCGVFRSGEIGDDLTWVITDADGFQVLGRNAAGETQYRYWLAGTYSVVLESWGGDYYVEVSNTVTINC